jgi:hypothetical protein
MESFIIALKNELDFNFMMVKNGDTQKNERYYIDVSKNIFDRLGATYECAPSQKKVDFRNVTFPDGKVYNMEFKSSGSNTFCHNDTMPSKDIVYVYIWWKKGVVEVFYGNKLSNLADLKPGCETPLTKEEILERFTALLKDICYAVNCGTFSLYDFSDLWKRTYVFGKLKFRPRPNISINLTPDKPN